MSTSMAASEFFVAGGTLGPDSPSYIKRPADEDLFGLALAGKFCYVLTARQMGKSSLMIRTDRRLKEQDVRTAIIDLTEIGTVSVDQWYLGLLTKIGDDLHLSVNPEIWWAERTSLGAVQRFTRFLREVVLKEIDGRVVIFVDEIDTTLRLDFADDFFAAIRAIYNARANEPEFNRLTFVLLGVATPSDLIRDKARTPFNIGQAIDLREFRWEDTQAFRQGMTAVYPDQGEAVFARIFYWTNGHPYLTQKLCLTVTEVRSSAWNDERVDKLVEKLFLSDEARKEANLQFVHNSVAASPQRRGLLGLYRKVYEGNTVPDDERSLEQNRLKLFGLVRAEKSMLKVRNEIYRHAFNLDWINANTPVDWTFRVAVLLALMLISVTVLFYFQQRSQTAQVQAQVLITNFGSTTSADVRINSLAGLFNLHGYEGRARQLFQELSPEEQRAMFNLPDPRAVGGQLITVTKGLYTDLENNEPNNELLRAMAQPLRKLDDPKATNLATEIEQWLQGRAYYGQREYQQAVMAYDVAISLNTRNPGTYFDRGLAYASLGETDKALTDLEVVLNLNSGKAWQDRVRQAVVSDDRLYAALWGDREKYKALVTVAPTPTETPSPILYSKDFEDGTADDWVTYVGTWSVEEENGNHFLRGTGPSNYPQAWLSQKKVDWTNWTDYAFESRIRFVRGNLLMCVRADEGSAFYNVYIQGGTDFVSFADYVAGKYNNSDGTSHGRRIMTGIWYTVRLEVKGDTLTLYIDDKFAATARRSSRQKGGVGFYMGGGDEIHFDDIRIWSLKP